MIEMRERVINFSTTTTTKTSLNFILPLVLKKENLKYIAMKFKFSFN